jgi:hypothetical protein
MMCWVDIFSYSAQKDVPVGNLRRVVKVVCSLLNQADRTVEIKREIEKERLNSLRFW